MNILNDDVGYWTRACGDVKGSGYLVDRRQALAGVIWRSQSYARHTHPAVTDVRSSWSQRSSLTQFFLSKLNGFFSAALPHPASGTLSGTM